VGEKKYEPLKGQTSLVHTFWGEFKGLLEFQALSHMREKEIAISRRKKIRLAHCVYFEALRFNLYAECILIAKGSKRKFFLGERDDDVYS